MKTLLFTCVLTWIGVQFAHAGQVEMAPSSPSHGFSACEGLNLESPQNALDMAELMGRYHIFNVNLLSHYEDEATFSPGEVLIVTSEDRWPEALQPFQKKGDTYFYQFQRKREVIAVRFAEQESKKRSLASGSMKLFTADRCALKKF